MNRVRILTLAITRECNLNCTYCYVNQKKGVLSLEKAKKILEEFSKSAEKNKEVIVTGGEPLLYESEVKEILLYAKKIINDISLNIVTNGTLINENLIDYLKKVNVKFFISFDGTIKNNDLCRKFPDGGGSGELVLSKIKMLEKHKIPFEIIMTISDFKEIKANIEFLTSHGVKDIKLNIIKNKIKLYNLPKIKKIVCNLEVSNSKKGVKIHRSGTQFKNPESNNWPCNIFEQILVRPDGTIVPCTHFLNSENKEHIIGEVGKTGVFLKENCFYESMSKKYQFCNFFNSYDGKIWQKSKILKNIRINKLIKQ